MRVWVDESKKAESLFKDERIVKTGHRKEKNKEYKKSFEWKWGPHDLKEMLQNSWDMMA